MAARSDSRRNRERLVRATGELLARGDDFTLAEVAARAGLSTATAYRHFGSAEAATAAYVGGFWDELDARVAAADPDLRELCGLWVDAVLEWGRALVTVRSREGVLARRARGDELLGRLLRIVEPRLPEPDRAYAFAVWNALADPREVLDQHATLGWDSAEIAGRLHAATVAASGGTLRAWPNQPRFARKRIQSSGP